MDNSLSKDEIDKLPLCQFSGVITVVEDELEVPGIIEQLLNEKFLGFDTETKPSFRKGENNKVSLIQISTTTEVYLFRLNKIGFPPALLKLLESKSVQKIGVGIRDDIRGLNKLARIKPGGFVDLQDVVKSLEINVLSLRGLAAMVLNVRISKRQRLSNWEADQLTNSQIDYAATDAWAALMIFKELVYLEPNIEINNIKLSYFTTK